MYYWRNELDGPSSGLEELKLPEVPDIPEESTSIKHSLSEAVDSGGKDPPGCRVTAMTFPCVCVVVRERKEHSKCHRVRCETLLRGNNRITGEMES